ncbi:transporter substrate-binding domain-containing protein [Shinella oryzae]|uniref:transporter substrate-binding domain-containing protein n=1 Tax=Shinella oryzae TaxID=2871820 RepID=UPI001FF3697A|nr:transporter substrate-binding domain-containing protein [Shinella oryzae]UPA27206.1 transporter substrate-binding domain-containing protein [Shinella oryzae]
MSMNRRRFLSTSAGVAGLLAAPTILPRQLFAADTIKVGSIFSLTGGLSIVERSLNDATRMAVTEINAAGGVLGKQIEVIAEDGASDPKNYNEKASKLLLQDRVSSVFACYTSASRKAVLPVFERRNGLLFYPTYYEGFECSKNVVYTGAVPNQQLSNFIPWIIKTLGKKKFFIVGSNYIYPREMAKVSKVLIEQNGGEWVADEYLELGHSEWASMVSKIKSSGCDVVLSNVVGDSVIAFYREFKNQGLSHETLPICATVTSEIEIAAMGAEYATGSYTSFPYFQAIDTPANKDFVARYRKFVGDENAVTHHALESSYFQVYLWKQAVEKSADTTTEAVRAGVGGQTFDAPGGKVTVEAENLHTALTPRIAQWQADGQGKIVDAYAAPEYPLPYVAYGEKQDNLFCTASGLDTSKLPG